MYLALCWGWSLGLLLRQVEDEGQQLGLGGTRGRGDKKAKKLASSRHLYYPHGLLIGQILNVGLQACKWVNTGANII